MKNIYFTLKHIYDLYYIYLKFFIMYGVIIDGFNIYFLLFNIYFTACLIRKRTICEYDH